MTERNQNILGWVMILGFILLCVGAWYLPQYLDKPRREKFDRDMAEIEANIAKQAKEEAEYRKLHQFDPKVVFRKQHVPSKPYEDRYRVNKHWRTRIQHTSEEFRVWYVNLNDDKVYMFECPNKQVFESIKLQDRIDSLSYAK